MEAKKIEEIDKRVSVLESKVEIYIEQIKDSIIHLERTITTHVDKSDEALKSYTNILNNALDKQREASYKSVKSMGTRIRKLEDERLKLSTGRLLLMWAIPTIIGVISFIRSFY